MSCVPQARRTHHRQGLPPELALIAEDGVNPTLLRLAAWSAELIGAEALTMVFCRNLCTEDRYYRLLAGRLGMAFRERPLVAGPLPRMNLTRARLAKLRCDAVLDYVLAPSPEDIRLLLGAPHVARQIAPHMGLTAPARLQEAYRQLLGEELAEQSAHLLAERQPALSARGRPDLRDGVVTMIILALVSLGLVLDDGILSLLAPIVTACLFLLQITLRGMATIEALASPKGRRRPIADRELPVYTVLVPLYRERRILPDLVRALQALDYPPAKLDVMILLEEDDHETRQAAAAANLPYHIRAVVCPAGEPKTKPRALNLGLRFARGDLVVVYDAEDRPDPGQLRLAAAWFHRLPPHVACLQAALAIDNAGEGWLPRFFALEYAQLFDVMLKGWTAMGLPIPLGGTSNHFRRSVLEEVCGWDAWNVTEDADLGIRLARAGYQVRSLPSTTWEEAPLTWRAWIRQRGRWLKGWLQTSLVHGLPTPRMARELGPLGLLAVVAQSYAVVISALGWPVFTAGLAFGIWSGHLLQPETVGDAALAALCPVVVILGAISLVWPWVLGSALRGLRLRPWDILLMPLYFMMLSLAAWMAVWGLLTAPSHWDKTEHGLARKRHTPGAARPVRTASPGPSPPRRPDAAG